MGKIIKKTVKSVIIFLGILLLIPAMIAIALQIPAVQTAVVNKIFGQISAELRSSITIGRIEYEFFNKLVLDDLLFKDRNNDTLLYARKLTAGIKRSSISNRNFRFGKVELEDPVFALITDTAGQMNLSWYLQELKNDIPDSLKGGANVMISRIDLTGARFSLLNNSKTTEKDDGKATIKFSDLQLSGINGVIEDFRIRNDTVSMNIFDLAFSEKNGFIVNHLTSRFSHADGSIMLTDANIRTKKTLLELEKLTVTGDSTNAFSNFIEEVRLDMVMKSSAIHTSDMRYFAPVPEGLEEVVSFSGRISGTIAELRGRNILLEYGTGTVLNCDFDFSGLPELENTFIYLGVNRFTTNAADLALLEIPGKSEFVVPEVLYRLGNIAFEGSFTGFTTDFVTYGEFRTDEGGLRTDLSLRPEKGKNYRVRGQVIGNSINLAGLTESKILGQLNMNVNVNGSASSLKEFSGEVRGTVDSIGINGYNYRNIQLSGKVSDKMWDGSVNVVDENIRFDLLGMFNFSDTLPEFNFTLNLAHADLYKLNIDRQDSTSSLSMILTTNFRGSNIDNLDGEIKLLSSTIEKHGTTMELYDFSVRSHAGQNIPTLSLRTDFLDADIKGKYNIKGLGSMFRTISASLMPSMYGTTGKIPDETGENDFIFDINFRNTDKINEFFRTGLLFAEGSYVKGSVRPGNFVTVEGKTALATYRNIAFNDLSFEANTSDSVLTTDIHTSGVILPGNTRLGNFSAGLDSKPDTFTIEAGWDNQEKNVNKGLVAATGSIVPDNGMGKPYLRIDIDSSEIYSSDDLWKINESSITINTSTIKFNNIHIGSNNRFYHVNGSVSENPADTLNLEFRGIDLSPLNNFSKRTAARDTNGIKMDLRGSLNGTVAMTGVYNNLLLESDLVINAFSILGSEYGDIYAYSEFDNSRKVVDIRARNDLRGVRMFEANGWYDPENKKISVGITTDKLPVEALNPLLSSFASKITGHTTGRVRLSGTTDRMVMNGSVMAENVSMKIDYLQTKYTLNDSIRFNRDGIRFANVRFLDEGKRPATITGTVFHSNFREYAADLTINMGSDEFLVLNTTLKDNPSFYGRVFAGGVVKIKTQPDLLSFDISARTGRNTSFFIPLSDELSVSEYSFISFVDSAGRSQSKVRVKDETKQLGLDVNIDLTVTSDATAGIIFDEKVGDKITGSGSGLLNITLNPKGDFRITGDYTIEQGDYLFTLGNILNKRFMVENGGRISFNGDLDDAEIELRAVYQKFNTSLFPVLHDPGYANVRIPVEPQILLSGKLFNPTVNFEINLPDSDEETKTYLRNAISSDEELSRQFMYLLVMKSFYAEQAGDYTNPTGTSAMAATTTEMLSNQLSNWISQISNDFNLGFTYRPGSGNREYNPDEVQIAFETQVLDDRVSLNGNFDYRGTSGNQTDQLTGDFEAEVKITEKIRFKVFNRFNDHQYTGKGPYTQGVGILFREDFENLRDLFRKKERKEARKEEEITIADQ